MVQTVVQHKAGSVLLSTAPDFTATQQLASILAPVSMQVLGARPKHVQHGKLAEADSASTDAGSSDSETDMGFLSSANCSDAGSDFDSVENSRLLQRVHRRPRPAPARRLRLQGSAGLVFRGTPLPTIPATPASKTSTWSAECLASSEDEEEFDRDTSEGRDDALRVIKHSALSPAPDRPGLTVGAAEIMVAPPGLLPASMPMFRPPPGLPPPPRAPPRQSTPTTLPVGRPILSTAPSQRFDSSNVPQPKLISSMVPPSHKAPIISEAELHKTPLDWSASSPADSKGMDVKSFLPPTQAEKVQLMLSTHGIRSSSALTAR